MQNAGAVYAYGALHNGEVRGDAEAMRAARALGHRLVTND
jgi:hypothetical protein